jgi:hypothetical protein
MKRRVLQGVLGFAGLLMFFRFGGPALLFGATGPGPLGNDWVVGTRATLLLDADLRFLGAMAIGIGVIFFWGMSRTTGLGPTIFILAATVAVGAVARIYARVVFGNPGTAGTVPIVIELVLPILIVFLLYSVGKDARRTQA